MTGKHHQALAVAGTALTLTSAESKNAANHAKTL